MGAPEWDARYAATELVWGAPPNAVVVEHLTSIPAGRALDLGCGEGRNAIWLATHGWRVRAADFSQVAIDKGRTVATRSPRAVRDRVTWSRADVTDTADEIFTGPFDLVLLCFLHLPAPQRRAVLRQAAGALAPAGTLLVLGHDTTNITEGHGGPQNPEILFTPDDIVADVGGALQILVTERRLRLSGGHEAIDALVVAHQVPAFDAGPA